MFDFQNSTLDDVSGVIGYSAAARMSGWWGGHRLYVPKAPNAEMVAVLGASAAKRLCDAWQGESIDVPRCKNVSETSRWRLVGAMYEAGISLQRISDCAGVSLHTARRIRDSLLGAGMVSRRSDHV